MAAEKQFENKIKLYLKNIGAYHVKFFGCAFTQSGTPDLLCCVNGHFVAIEVKAERGKPSELQLHNLKKIHEAGGYAILAYPKDWLQLQSIVERLMNYKFDEARSLYMNYFVPRFEK